METYSVTTGKTYDSWDDLVAAESNGYVSVVTISDSKKSWPWVQGPYPTEADANRAAARMRNKLNREKESFPDQTHKVQVRPVWKDPR